MRKNEKTGAGRLDQGLDGAADVGDRRRPYRPPSVARRPIHEVVRGTGSSPFQDSLSGGRRI